MTIQHFIPYRSLARAIVIFGLCLGISLFAEEKNPDAESGQQTNEKSPGDKDKVPSGDKTPEKNADAEPAPKESQFKKNASRSGMQIGVEDSKSGLPRSVEHLAKEGALASAGKDWEKARDAYQRMVAAAPDNALALSNLGIVEYRLKDYQNAATHLEQSVKINPHISQNWLTLGLSHYYLKQFNLAISALTRAKHEDPKDPRTCLYLAVVIRDYGWGSAAETELMRAIALDPDYADAHFNLALLYLERTPPAIELARRHYFFAIDLGAQRDEKIEKRLKKINDPPSKK
jgi:tetratricopeptide (TPR) repeat protein